MSAYAIAIGIDHYRERPLEGAVNDATAFSKWFIASHKISEDMRADRLKLITSADEPTDPPTDREINAAAREIYESVQQNGGRGTRLYFYFAGHGLGLTYTNTVLCMRPYTSFFNGECISATKWLDGLIQLDLFDEIIFFLDCCRHADLLPEGALGPRWWQPGMQAINTRFIVFYATKYGESSQEIEVQELTTSLSRKRGAFTTFLLRALEGDAGNAQGEVLAFTLINHLDNQFKSFTSTLRYIQKAEVHHNLGSQDILITRVSQVAKEFNCEIVFRKDRNRAELTNKDLELVRFGAVKKDEKWQVKLPIGIHTLTDCDIPLESGGREKTIKIFSLITISHEQF